LSKRFCTDDNNAQRFQSDARRSEQLGRCVLLRKDYWDLTVACRAPSPVDAKYRGKFFTLFFSIGLSEVIWYGFRVEYVTFFGSHLVAFLILLTGLIWFVVLVVKMIKNYSKEKQEWEKQQVRQKYLPNN
jgi:hypothetical protein